MFFHWPSSSDSSAATLHLSVLSPSASVHAGGVPFSIGIEERVRLGDEQRSLRSSVAKCFVHPGVARSSCSIATGEGCVSKRTIPLAADDGESESSLAGWNWLIMNVPRTSPCRVSRLAVSSTAFDPFEHQMGRVGNESRDRSDQPFGRVDHVRQCVLNRAAARLAVVEVDIAIGRTEGGKMLAADNVDLDRFAEATFVNRVLHGRKDGVAVIDVGDRRDEVLFLNHTLQARLSRRHAVLKRFFDEQVNALFRQPRVATGMWICAGTATTAASNGCWIAFSKSSKLCSTAHFSHTRGRGIPGSNRK